MTVLNTAFDPHCAASRDNRAAVYERLVELSEAITMAQAGGGERYATRHHARGKLLPRERIELLVDRDAPLLELSPIAGWGTEYPIGAGVVTSIGVVEGVECVIVANDPTVRGGAVNPYSLRKALRASEIALANRLPLVNLVESGGSEVTNPSEIFIPGGQIFRELTRLSAAGVPTLSAVFGNATAGGAYVPAMSDHTIMVRDRAKVFLAGPRLVKMATGEDCDDESLGGAAMHATTSGLADHLAEDERDALRLVRQCVRRLNWHKQGQRPRPLPAAPKYDPDDLLALASSDPRMPVDPREILARVLDGAEFDEFKPAFGTALCTGWGELHGYPIGVLANTRGALLPAESQKAAHFIQLANTAGTPLLFLQNATGHLVGPLDDQADIIKHGALMLNAVANSAVPHLTVNIGGGYTSGNDGMCGRSFSPRFLFSWPNTKSAADGPPADESRSRVGTPRDLAAEHLSGPLHDDGVIDPRDTRTVLGICLSALHSGPVRGAGNYGVFRM